MIGAPGPVIDGIVAHRLEREEQVITALAGLGRAGVDDLLPAVYADVTESLRPVARYSLWAHLQKLALDGRVRLVGPENNPLGSTEASLWEPVGPG
jgi:hypothetical protein